MRYLAFGWVAVLFLSSTVWAAPKELACHDYFGKKNKPVTQKFGDLYQIKVEFTPGRDISLGKSCTGRVFSKHGQEMLTIEGHSIVFDRETSKLDFDGDSKPELVFKTNTTGAQKCCWVYSIFSFNPNANKIVDVDQKGDVEFKADGKFVKVSRMEPGPFGFTSMARNPYAKRVYVVKENKLQDVTKDHCDDIWKDSKGHAGLAVKTLSPKTLEGLKNKSIKKSQLEDVRSAILTAALQNVFCGQIDKAVEGLKIWPDENIEDVKAVFAKNIEIEFPEAAEKLRQPQK